MKLCSVTVWYNPDESCVKNILTYSSVVEKCYIIDNSDSDNSDLSSEITNAVYLPNMANLGIAKALNAGCENALSDGFEWCMTMDQDSSWNETDLQAYFASIEKYSSQENVSFAPNLKPDDDRNYSSFFGDFLRKFLKNAHECPEPFDVLYPNKVITSGNVIALPVWDKIGKFYEPFFIDEVDHEFCFRLRRNEFKLIFFPKIFMNHQLGKPKRTIFPKLDNHDGVRLYYMVRNGMYIKKNYPDFYKTERYKSIFLRIIFDNVIRLRFGNLKQMIKGFCDE